LIVDEVLAVGDVQFQRKCLGKMDDVSRREARTVLFVSHNMDAIERLCPRCLLLDGGRVVMDAPTADVVPHYLATHGGAAQPGVWMDVSGSRRQGTGECRFAAIRFQAPSGRGNGRPVSGGPVEFDLEIESSESRTIGSLAVAIYSLMGAKLVNADLGLRNTAVDVTQGRNRFRIHIDALHLNPGSYVVGLWMATTNGMDAVILDFLDSAAEIEVISPSKEEMHVPDDGHVRSMFSVSRLG
jgi:lipopolysaccharide transport system ATP-binding protein